MRISDWSSDVCSSDLVGNQDSDPAFRQLFASWTKVNTLEQAMLSVPALKPVISFAMTSNFGVRNDPFNGGVVMHSGIDMAGRTGEPIYSTADRSEEHTSELQSLMRNSYAVLCLKKNT